MEQPVAVPASAPAKPKGRWRSLIAMAFALLVDNTEGGLINGLFPVIRDALGLSLTSLGLFTSISRFARMIFGPFWAMVADKYGRKKILVFVTGIWGVWTVLAGLAQTYPQLLILYSIGVIGTVASEPIANGILGDMFSSTERGKAFGSIRAIATFGAVIMTPLIGQLANVENGWRYGMFIMGGLSIFSGILILFFVQEPRVGGAEKELSVKDIDVEELDVNQFHLSEVLTLLHIPTILLLAVNLIFITSLVLFGFLVVFLVDVRGFTTANANIVLAFFILGFAISSVLGGFLGDWFERRNPRVGRVIFMQIYLVMFAVMSYLSMQISWPSTAAYYLIWFLFGLIGSLGFSGVVLPMVSAVVVPEMRSTAFALLFALIQGAISALLSLAMGMLSDRFGLANTMFWLITVPYAVNAVFWFVFYKYYPRDVANMKEELESRVAKAASI